MIPLHSYVPRCNGNDDPQVYLFKFPIDEAKVFACYSEGWVCMATVKMWFNLQIMPRIVVFNALNESSSQQISFWLLLNKPVKIL